MGKLLSIADYKRKKLEEEQAKKRKEFETEFFCEDFMLSCRESTPEENEQKQKELNNSVQNLKYRFEKISEGISNLNKLLKSLKDLK